MQEAEDESLDDGIDAMEQDDDPDADELPGGVLPESPDADGTCPGSCGEGADDCNCGPNNEQCEGCR